MLWRLWALLAALPVGLLAALIGMDERRIVPPTRFALCAAAAGAVMLVAVSLLARGGDRARGAHLARGASAGWMAIPLCASVLLGLEPGAATWLAVMLIVLFLTLLRGARARGPATGPARAVTDALAYGLGGVAVAVLTGGLIAAGAEEPQPPDERGAAGIYKVDASVVTQSLPDCAQQAGPVELIHGDGAHPRLSRDGEWLWFDARDERGLRQVQRMHRPSGRVVCWTCGQPGNNRRPYPSATGSAVVFDTDRHVHALAPANTELHYMPAFGDEPRAASRRLTFTPGADDHAMLTLGGRTIVWTHGREGRHEVVAAGLSSGHGSLMLGKPRMVAQGGARWIAAADWSADARSLVVARGNPRAPLAARSLDPATFEESVSWTRLAGPGGVSFSADGGWRVSVEADGRGLLARLPAALGFVIAPLLRGADDGVLYRGAEAATGAAPEPPRPLAGTDFLAWGSPTGVALEPDGMGLVLGQRRVGADGADRVEERLVRIALACTP